MRIYVTAGFAPDGRILEAFFRAERHGSEMDFQLDDAAVLVSRGLQRGDTIADLCAGVGRIHGDKPSSLIGCALDSLAKIEAYVARGQQ